MQQSTALDVKDEMMSINLLLFSFCAKWRLEFLFLLMSLSLEFKYDSTTNKIACNNNANSITFGEEKC